MFLDIAGNKVFTLSFGRGPRTLLAHSGWVGNVEDWIATLAPLSADWRTVVYDHRGTGETVVPVDAITHEALVDDVFAVMDALSIDTCVLAGFSRGVMTVMRAVLRHPERFEGLVLMNGTGEVQLPGAAPAPRVPPSKWPGETHRDRLRWFIERSTPEPDVEHIRRWGTNILARATPEAAERIMSMQWETPVHWARAAALAPADAAAARREGLPREPRDDALHAVADRGQQARGVRRIGAHPGDGAADGCGGGD